MELLLEIDEMDIPYVKAGQEATIIVDALPDTKFIGQVTTISPVAKEIGGVVLYDVKIKLDVPDNSAIKVGMSAIADIVVSEANNIHN